MTGAESHHRPAQGSEVGAWLDALFERAPLGAAICEADGVILRANESLGRIVGVAPGSLAGSNLRDLVEAADRDAVETLLRTHSGEARAYVRAPGKDRTAVLLTAATAPTPPSQAGRVVAFFQAVPPAAAEASETRSGEGEISEGAFFDPLTGLYNKLLFMDRLTHALARAERLKTPVAVLFVDLDHFQLITEQHGRTAADEVLREMSRLLEGSVRPADTVARLGGDQFAVLCEDTTGERDAVTVARRLGALLTSPLAIGDLDVPVSASVGIAFAGRDDTPESLLKSAGAAMYRVKEGGRGTYQISLDALDE